jgi:hypothetical protein
MTSTVHRMLPLYEGKMMHLYDHRWATHEADGSVRLVTLGEKRDQSFAALPRYWLREEVVADRLPAGLESPPSMVGWRDIARSTDERTVICAQLPLAAAGHNLPLLLGVAHPGRLVAVLSSFILDFVARPKVGGTHLSYFILDQLPIPVPEVFEDRCSWAETTIGSWVDDRVTELTSRWDPGRRLVLRAELDAAMFHLYGVDDRDDVDYILGTFPIVNRKDVAEHGEERTRRLVLENYDAMAEAARTGIPFTSSLSPPPGEEPRHEPMSEA